MNWYKAVAKFEAKHKFAAIETGETVNFRINEDQETVTCKYTWQFLTFTKEEYLNYIIPLLKEGPIENSGFVECRHEVSQAMENAYQELVKQKKAFERQEKKKIAEQELIATLDENQLVDFELQKKVTELVSNPLLKTKKDKIVLLVKELGLKKKTDIQKYFPTDKSYLDEVFEKHIYGTLISFEEKRQLEIC